VGEKPVSIERVSKGPGGLLAASKEQGEETLPEQGRQRVMRLELQDVGRDSGLGCKLQETQFNIDKRGNGREILPVDRESINRLSQLQLALPPRAQDIYLNKRIPG